MISLSNGLVTFLPIIALLFTVRDEIGIIYWLLRIHNLHVLLILGGAKFIQQLSGAATDESSFVEQFDSAIKQHNFYPTEEECAQIDPEIVSNAASVLKGLKNAPNKIGMHSSSRPSQLSSVPAKKEMQPFAVKSEPEVIPSDEMDTQSDNDTDTVLTPKIGTISIGAKACHRHQTAYQEAAGCMEQGKFILLILISIKLPELYNNLILSYFVYRKSWTVMWRVNHCFQTKCS